METMVKEVIEDLFDAGFGGNMDGGMVQNMIDGISYTYSGSPNHYIQVDCNSNNEHSIWIEFPFHELTETECFEREIDTLKDIIIEELGHWTDTNSLNRGSLKNLSIELIRTFFSNGFAIDLDSKEFIDLCKWQSRYRD
tara:strand:- start:156 stop:572 length:417 start_codon:yes stop_codon:yes gene_type:complete